MQRQTFELLTQFQRQTTAQIEALSNRMSALEGMIERKDSVSDPKWQIIQSALIKQDFNSAYS